MQKMRNMDTAINDYTEVAIRKQWELFIQRGDKLGHSEGKLRRGGIQKNSGAIHTNSPWPCLPPLGAYRSHLVLVATSAYLSIAVS